VVVHHPVAGAGRAAHETPLITDAKPGTSRELASRQKRYIITMAFRTACFLSMLVVTGPFRWVLLACAVFLPYVAVVFANQANRRDASASRDPVEPSQAPQLTDGAGAPSEPIRGTDDEDPPERDGRAA